MWTTLGPGVCQQALFTLTSFQPLFGVVPICSPSRPESNAHHARLLRGRVLPACASALSAPAALGCGLAKLDLSAGSSGELVPRAPTHTGGWWSASASGWKYIEPTTVLGGFTSVARSSCWSQPTCSTIRSLQQPQLCRATAYLSWSLTHFLSTSARLILTLFNTMNYGHCSFCCGMAMHGLGTDVPHPPH